ncbi:MAG: molecular chaperone DnaK, partial [Chitinivibrionales bacterium]
PELAVARGAAYYGLVRRGIGVRIDAGLARSYYIGVATKKQEPQAICLAPAGLKEEQTVQMEQSFKLLIRQPVEFPLYASSVRTTDEPGALVGVDSNEITALPPIRTVLKSGKKAAADAVEVKLYAYLTPIGTLELWCAETEGDRRWRLQFDVRAATQTDVQAHTGHAEVAGFIDAQTVERSVHLLRQTFDSRDTKPDPKSLVKRLEHVSDMQRSQWPPSFLRQLWETLIDVKDARRFDPLFEARWLNLVGYALRPGYGYAVDDWRIRKTWQLFREKVAFPSNQQCRTEWWVLWRRIAGGLSAGQQQALTSPLIATVKAWTEGGGSKKKKSRAVSTAAKIGSHELTEVWRLLGSCEHLPVQTKQELGEIALRFPQKNRQVFEAVLWALARLGARVPMYGPLNELIDAETVERWLEKIMRLPLFNNSVFCVMQLARKTGDRYRDINAQMRGDCIGYLKKQNAPSHMIALVEAGGWLEQEEESMVFGESLPHGLRL